jgi:hypothetical protein
MCLTCLHLNRENNTIRVYLNQQFVFALPSFPRALTVERRRGRPAGSTAGFTNRRRIDTSTRREPSAFERNTGYTTSGRGRGRGRGVPAKAACRRQAEVVTAKLVHILPHKSPRNPINQLRSMWVVLQVVLQVVRMVVKVKTLRVPY